MGNSRLGVNDDRVRQLYEQAVAAYGPALKRLARAYEPDAERRKDLLQELHLARWQSLTVFDGRCALGTWVYRVAHNTATSISIRRRQTRSSNSSASRTLMSQDPHPNASGRSTIVVLSISCSD